jgi:hypothetical protein
MKITPLGEKGTPMARVLHIEIEEKYDLAMTFLRMQEWYESPKFHHKNFTLETFMRWYSKEFGKGAFTYPKDWSGFNVPGEAAVAVLNHMAPLSEAEEKLLYRVIDMGLIIEPDPTRKGNNWGLHLLPAPFYMVGTHGKADPSDLPHEASHGKFCVFPDYRREVLRVLRRHNTKPLADKLLKMGYSKWTLEDEIHAYALTGWPEGFKPTPSLRDLRRELRAISDSK